MAEESSTKFLDQFPELVNEVKIAFNLFDKNNNGTIETKELATVLRSLGQDPTEQELENMIRENDPEDKGKISFDAFKRIMSERLKGDSKQEELLEYFKLFDKELTGQIDTESFKNEILSLTTKLNEQEVDEMMKECDPQGQGQFFYGDFVIKIFKT